MLSWMNDGVGLTLLAYHSVSSNMAGWGIFNCHEYQDQEVGLLDRFIVGLPTLVNLILGERIMLFL
jgi:hypothetical protein